MTAPSLGWAGIVRLGLVQTALGAIVVLTTSTMNRVMVVELALPAMLPGALVGVHYAVQLLRPRFGHGSDVGGRRTPWIVGGIAVLVLLAKRVAPGQRAAAATIVWVMMIAGFILTAAVAGHYLDPYSPARLVVVTSVVGVAAFLLSLVAVWRVEGSGAGVPGEPRAGVPFRDALRHVWSEREARRFTVFVFVSMLAFSAQDLILEPYAGTVFGYTPGESTQLSGVQNAGVLTGMVLVALAGTLLGASRAAALRAWTVAGCLASAVALFGLAAGASVGGAWPLRAWVFALGVANGAFAVAAIGSMMALASAGRESREGVRMGLWGAAQAIAFAAGGLAGTVAVDVARLSLGSPAGAYGLVFGAEAVLFLVSAWLALRVGRTRTTAALALPHGAEPYASGLGRR